MAALSDYEELDLTGLNIDHVRPSRSILRANYGEGYADTTRVGSVGGTRAFQLSAGVWPDDGALATIDGVSWMEYYTTFFDERLDNANEPFIIEWRNRKWLVDMAETAYGAECHTSDLFTPDGITLNLRRLRGLTFALDGSVFDPSLIESYMWGRYRNAQAFPHSFPGPIGDAWKNELEGDVVGLHALVVNGDVVSAPNVHGTHDAVRFNFTTNNGYLAAIDAAAPDDDPTIYDVWFVMKMRETTFSNFAGVLTADATIAALVGAGSATARFFNFTIGSSYSYEKNNVTFPEADQQAPMNVFGVVHARFENGITLANLQVGKDRAATDRYSEMDVLEFVPCNISVPDYWAEAFNRWLMTYYTIP